MKDKKRDQEPLKHWIIPGDWIIREAPEPGELDDEGFEYMRNPTGFAFSDRAIHVIGVTASHIVVFDPIAGRQRILQLSLFPGTWRKANKVQIEATWEAAIDHAKEPRDIHLLGELRKKYDPK